MNILGADIESEDITVDGRSFSAITAEIMGSNDYRMLIPAWLPFYSDHQGDHEQIFVWEMLDDLKDGMMLPLLMCPDDRDLRCDVITVKIRLTDKEIIFDGMYRKTGRYSHTQFRNTLREDLSDDDCVDLYVNYGGSDDDFQHWTDDHWVSHMKQRVDAFYSRYFADENNFTLIDSRQYVFSKKNFYSCVEIFRYACNDV